MRTTTLFLCAASLPLVVQGFAPLPSLRQNKVSAKTQHGMMVAPEHVDFMNAAVDHFHASSSNILADAAVAVADDKGGWWQQYLSIFKATLMFVHSTVDEPLKSVGITQSWGISIAIFTAGEFIVVMMRCMCSRYSTYTHWHQP
jgi:hypothetical protein